ncbi:MULTISPECIES: cytochrome c biogenesis protein CcdA [unclassified Bradyrhizobium]|uniref:cytochrome c biogenesis CcdA family protein n=1 Tax=unclassified Bradyrhizobium TaxID=2631580 RepID=UPI001BAC6B20|nr:MULTISPECIES: cytochrome c biogenesis protein CcdA [unclassified Bradyrhizobium]MBR1208102.1 cytochrome C biogenesis protein [Bradyrhizobium sp. AUGA SZCCT0124]MBR1316489.1 cytochrome C biogenesis protein [Bradyrhizobium sp. AUGA SZCCT0051]MBR1344616.1 cytochrome C biogenesis protein [Bradyrhizobium sp. AUGA SZCCT0105]MBR1359510.1 cytochrome C biogenesis protein [Bradyrhizobium sp. AUGA SZCCT0045]
MIDADALRQAVEHAGVAAAGIAFLTGLLFSFNPVALASIPVSLAYVTRGRDKGQALVFGAMFIGGMILAHVALGLIAGLGGKWAADIAGRGWGLFLGPLLILLGLMWTGWLRIPLPSFGYRASRPAAAWGAFLLGIPFAIAVCPVCTPTLVVLLGVTAGIGSVWLGVVLLLAFALGRAVPVAIGAFAVGWLENLKQFARYRRGFEIAGGVVLIAMGFYMLNAVYIWIPGLAI